MRINGIIGTALTGLLMTGCGLDGALEADAITTDVTVDGKADGQGHSAKRTILISDQYNNRVIEVDAKHNVVWQFGDGASVAGPSSVVAPNDAQRVGTYTLISGTGAPAGAEPTCTDACGDNRVLLVTHAGKIAWQYGQDGGVSGSGPNQLNAPVAAVYLPNGHVLITDQGNQRVIEVNGRHHIVWQYGTTGTSGADANQLNNPNSAELLSNGNILIADEGNNRVIEVDRYGDLLWQYGDPNDTTLLNGPAFASRLADGHTLISDASNNRIVEIDAHGKVVFNFATTSLPGSVTSPNPTRAVRLRSGNTLISDQNNHQVIEITPAAKVVFQQGQIGVSGNGANQLNGPYDAKVVGDFTGLTPPY